MTNIMPIGPLRPYDFKTIEALDLSQIANILLSAAFILFTQWLTHIILLKTPLYGKSDKRNPIYHIVAAISMSMMLFSFGWSMELIKGTVFLFLLLYASVCDIQTHEVKDFVSIMILLTAFIDIQLTNLPGMAISGLLAFVFLLICAIASGNRLGGADVKLSAACIFLLGLQKGFVSLIIGLLLAVVCNLLHNRKNKENKAFPLVPYLSFGFMVMYFF